MRSLTIKGQRREIFLKDYVNPTSSPEAKVRENGSTFWTQRAFLHLWRPWLRISEARESSHPRLPCPCMMTNQFWKSAESGHSTQATRDGKLDSLFSKPKEIFLQDSVKNNKAWNTQTKSFLVGKISLDTLSSPRYWLSSDAVCLNKRVNPEAILTKPNFKNYCGADSMASKLCWFLWETYYQSNWHSLASGVDKSSRGDEIIYGETRFVTNEAPSGSKPQSQPRAMGEKSQLHKREDSVWHMALEYTSEKPTGDRVKRSRSAGPFPRAKAEEKQKEKEIIESQKPRGRSICGQPEILPHVGWSSHPLCRFHDSTHHKALQSLAVSSPC